jgi:hypothetical protein
MLKLKLHFTTALRPNPNGTVRWVTGKTNTSCRAYSSLNSYVIGTRSQICTRDFLPCDIPPLSSDDQS